GFAGAPSDLDGSAKLRGNASSFRERIEAVPPASAIVMLAEIDPEGVGRPALQEVAHHDQVAHRLAHFGPVVFDHGRVQPAADEGRATGERLRLRDLALVVWKDQVAASCVEIEHRSQQARAHHRALDVPARAPWPPWTRPCRLAGRLRLPEHK